MAMVLLLAVVSQIAVSGRARALLIEDRHCLRGPVVEAGCDRRSCGVGSWDNDAVDRVEDGGGGGAGETGWRWRGERQPKVHSGWREAEAQGEGQGEGQDEQVSDR